MEAVIPSPSLGFVLHDTGQNQPRDTFHVSRQADRSVWGSTLQEITGFTGCSELRV